MDYLYNATSNWSNVPNIEMDYTDEGNNYGSIKTEGNLTKITKKDLTEVTVLGDKKGYTNLKARMPMYGEVHGTGKCLTYEENGNKDGSCPLWLSNFSEESGYWTLSSDADVYNSVWHVDYYGSMGSGGATYGGGNGVRPVITIKL